MIENKVKCLWKKLYETKNSTTFYNIKNNPSEKIQACVICDGYKTREQCCNYTNSITINVKDHYSTKRLWSEQK